MIRIVRMTAQLWGYEFDDLQDEAENIKTFVDEGTPVILVSSLEDLYYFGMHAEDVKMVTRDDN